MTAPNSSDCSRAESPDLLRIALELARDVYPELEIELYLKNSRIVSEIDVQRFHNRGKSSVRSIGHSLLRKATTVTGKTIMTRGTAI